MSNISFYCFIQQRTLLLRKYFQCEQISTMYYSFDYTVLSVIIPHAHRYAAAEWKGCGIKKIILKTKISIAKWKL